MGRQAQPFSMNAEKACNDMSVSFDPSISLGSLLTIGGFIVGGLGFVFAVKSDVRNVTTRFDQTSKYSNAQIDDLKQDVKELNKMTTELGRIAVAMEAAGGRANLIDERLTAQGKRLDDVITQVRELGKELSEIRHAALAAA